MQLTPRQMKRIVALRFGEGMSAENAAARVEMEALRARAIRSQFPGGIPRFTCEPDGEGKMSFRCPACGKKNTHKRREGHRLAHCACWPLGYQVRLGGGGRS